MLGAIKVNSQKMAQNHIYVKFDRDDTALKLVMEFSKIFHNNPNSKIRRCQQFSKKLQNRRNSVLLKHKELFNDKEIAKGYVEYPATLKVLCQGTNKNM